MSRRQYLLAGLFVVVILFLFVLPELMPNRLDELVLLYARKDDVVTDVIEGVPPISTVAYLFKLDIFLELFSKVVGAFSLLGLLYQFSRERNISEAEFVLNINDSFITNESLMQIYRKLEESKAEGQRTDPFDESEITLIANYLSFFEPFFGLLQQKVVKFSAIDQLAYRFFLATNNRFVQQVSLCRPGYETAWKDLYKLHHLWKTHRTEKNDLEIWQAEHDLSKCPRYSEILSLHAR